MDLFWIFEHENVPEIAEAARQNQFKDKTERTE
jgi:hypothetical protein